jgi:hypothetical protein
VFDFLRRKHGMADSFDAIVELPMDSSAGHTNETTNRQVDARGKLGVTVGTFLVRRKPLQLTERLLGGFWRLATIARVGAGAIGRSRSRRLQHG